MVPDDLLEALSHDQRDPAPALADAARCVSVLGGNASAAAAKQKGCEWGDPRILALDPAKARAAVLLMPEVPTAGGDDECDDSRALTFDIATARTTVRTKWKGPSCEGRGLAVSRLVAGLPAEGFTAEVRSLITARGSVAVGATGHSPVAVLDAPLCGSMLYVSDDDRVRLVAPTNDASVQLGTLMVNEYPSFEEVVLSPDRKYLLVLVSTTAGGHNLPLHYSVVRFALPANVKLAGDAGTLRAPP